MGWHLLLGLYFEELEFLVVESFGVFLVQLIKWKFWVQVACKRVVQLLLFLNHHANVYQPLYLIFTSWTQRSVCTFILSIAGFWEFFMINQRKKRPVQRSPLTIDTFRILSDWTVRLRLQLASIPHSLLHWQLLPIFWVQLLTPVNISFGIQLAHGNRQRVVWQRESAFHCLVVQSLEIVHLKKDWGHFLVQGVCLLLLFRHFWLRTSHSVLYLLVKF